MKIIVTGGAGFIGSHLSKLLIRQDHHVLCIDCLDYSGNITNISNLLFNNKFIFNKVDITNTKVMQQIFLKFKPDVVFHLAAKSHVDKSIDSSTEFFVTNVLGTQVVCEAIIMLKNNCKLIHVSTDEVFGSLKNNDSMSMFNEQSAYQPNSPYAASKAAAEMLIKSYIKTYNLPAIITNCSNNFGPYQYPEKLVPLLIMRALSEQSLPIYGNGMQIRDWIHVNDHIEALTIIAKKGKIGEQYCIGANSQCTNLSMANKICKILEQIYPLNNGKKYQSLIEFVADRPGHDQRYAIDASKLIKELNWHPQCLFEESLYHTVNWYKNNQDWAQISIKEKNCLQRVGVGK